MGFLNDFGRGFSEGLQKRIDLKDQQDAKVKAEIQVLDYKDALEQRAKEKAAAELAKQRNGPDGYLSKNPSMSPFQPTSNLDSFGLPKGTQDTPAVSTPTSTVSTTTPESLDSYMSQFIDIQNRIGKAYLYKDPEAAKVLETQAEILKQKMTNHKELGKPALTTEGYNPVDVIDKQDAANRKAVATDPYAPPSIAKKIGDPNNTSYEESLLAHKALTSAVAEVNKDRYTSATPQLTAVLAKDTQEVIKNLNILKTQDPNITMEMRKKAASNIENSLVKMAPTDDKAVQLMSNPNFQAVFDADTQKLIQSYNNSTKTTTPTDTTKPIALSRDKPAVKANTSTTKPAITKAEYDKLPSGATYLHPDGTYRTKP